jgi:hypothetical protein
MNTKELKIDNRCASNVANIELSEELKVLFLCQAQMSDVFNNVSNVIDYRYSGDKFFKDFEKAHAVLDNEMMKIISMFIEVTMIESDYTKI